MHVIYGGTFDPIHHGHLRLALEVSEALEVSRVHLVPSHIPPHRGSTGASSAQRLEMIRQAIAGEIELDHLLALLMTSALENSGAQVGCLLLPEEGRWMIVAQADSDGSKPLIEQPISMTESAQLSQSVVNYVIRTQQTMLLDDASQSGRSF